MSTRAIAKFLSAVTSSLILTTVTLISPAVAETISACLQNKSGEIKFVDSAADCIFNETFITWNDVEPVSRAGADGQDAVVPEYSLGGTGPAGGFVFYLTTDNLHGLEAAPVDQVSAGWGCSRKLVAGATGTRLGSGEHNTQHIVEQCGTGTAADVADAYEFNGYYDWYLPSKDGIYLIYTNLVLNAQGGFAESHYWSSSEFDTNHAWFQFFVNGNQIDVSKYNSFSVRAVRAF